MRLRGIQTNTARMLAGALLLVATLVTTSAIGTARAGDLERGEVLWALCQQCHGSAGQGNQLAMAPSIAGLPAWYTEYQLHAFRSGVRGKHPDDVGGLRMHPMALWIREKTKDEDIQALGAYVESLPPSVPAPVLEGGSAERGKQYYNICVACHGPEGKGNPALNAPAIVDMNDWYLLSSLQKYKAGIRGTGDKVASVMIGMSSTLPDDQAMRDVVAYIMTLRNE